MQQEPFSETPDNAINKPALQEGQKLAGCYVLKSKLPTQGAAIVWLAQDEVLGKDVSLHFIPPAVLQDSRAVSELRQEVKRNRQLIHPNILRVYDFVEDGPFTAISMDRIEGESLAVLLKQKGHFEPQDIQPWLIQISETLIDAHRTQFVHRDLVPENFFIRPEGGIVVTNLGIGRTICDALERVGIAKGEEAHLAYTSPQQIDGERAVPSDDVYGFGAFIYELLTGRPPFVGQDIVPQIRKIVPPTMSEARKQAGASALSPEWDNLVSACLAKSADQRPKSFVEVASLLSQAKHGALTPSTPTVAAPSSENSSDGHSVKASTSAIEPLLAPVWTDLRQKGAELSTSNVAASIVDGEIKPVMPPLPHGAPSSSSTKSNSKPTLSPNFPDLDRPKSKAPAVFIGLAAVLIGAGIYIKKSSNEPEDTSLPPAEGKIGTIDKETSGAQPMAKKALDGKSAEPKKVDQKVFTVKPTDSKTGVIPEPAKTTGQNPTEIKPVLVEKVVNPALADPKASDQATTVGLPTKLTPSPAQGVATSLEVKPALPLSSAEDIAPKMASAVLPAPDAISKSGKPMLETLPTAPAPLPKLTLPTKATASQLEQLLAERQAASVHAQEVAKAAEAAQTDAVQHREKRVAELDQMKKSAEEKRKAQASVIQQASAIEAQRKKLEDEKNRAKAAAMEAVKASEAAEKSFADAMEQGGDKLAARQKAESEITELTKEIAERTKTIDESGGQSTKADSLRQQMQLTLRQLDQDKQAISAALVKVKSAEDEVRRKANHEKIVSLENQIKPIEAQAVKIKDALSKLRELGDAGVELSKPLQQKLDSLNAQVGEIQSAVKELGNSSSAPTTNQQPINLPPPVQSTLPPATSEQPAPLQTNVNALPVSNTLGMKFVPVGDVQFAVYPTTRQQFETFVKSANLRSAAWQNPGFKQDGDHPVVNVTWREADAFCKWLTTKERKTNQIKTNEVYRLPSDMEWSKAVGLPTETGQTPEERDMEVQGVYPWGTTWPPPAGSGNFAGEETEADTLITGYNDGYKNTSPVGKFSPNTYGLYDMSGNVWQWVQDDWNADNRAKTLRGGSWYNGAIQLSLLSSCRISSSPENPNDTYGFRIVKATEAAKTIRR